MLWDRYKLDEVMPDAFYSRENSSNGSSESCGERSETDHQVPLRRRWIAIVSLGARITVQIPSRSIGRTRQNRQLALSADHPDRAASLAPSRTQTRR